MSDHLIVATRKGLFRYTRQNGDWRHEPPAFLGEPVTAALRDPRDGALIVALRHGHFGVKIHRSEDGGITWDELTAPAFSPLPNAATVEDAPRDDGKDGPSVDLIWTLAAGGRDEPGVIWAGTLPGALFRGEDGGQRWTLVESLWNKPEREKWFGGGYDQPGIHSVLVDPRDARRLTVAISCGGVWRSDNGGADWRQAGQGLRNAYMPAELAFDPVSQDPHRLANCGVAPDTVWCQHHNGVFRSTDGGDTFVEITDITPSVFGFAVAAHPTDPDTAWFVPAVKDECRVPVDGRLVVTRTTDGGCQFEALGTGLPERDCHDLIYRHALAVDETGNWLAMGSTTGNLWVSEDGGDNWHQLSAHLPPIAEVLFG